MRRYDNYSSKIRRLILPLNIIFIGLTIIRWMTFEGEDFIDAFVMSIGFVLICVLFDFMFIYLKYLMHDTKFNSEKIVQKYIFKEKSIRYDEVKTILLVGTVIVLCDYIVDVSKLPKKGNILKKFFSDDVMFYLGNSNSILDAISNNVNCKAYIINHTLGSNKRFETYFTVEKI